MNPRSFDIVKFLILCIPFALGGGFLACSGENTTGVQVRSLDESREYVEEDDVSSSSKDTSKEAGKETSISWNGEVTAQSSSSQKWTIIGREDVYMSSSSRMALSSSSAMPLIPMNAFGTCAPTTSVAERDQTVSWSFSWDKVGPGLSLAEILQAEYNWDLPGGTAVTGANSRTASTTYSTSGLKTASVTVMAGGMVQQIECSPLNVNGTPITGCKCVGTNLVPDVSRGEDASWTVSGCTSAAKIIGYMWAGATASTDGQTATAAVSARGDKVTGVSVVVENDDNTKVTLQCDDANAVDSSKPVYLFEISGNQIPSQKLEVPSGACMSIRGTWEDELFNPNVSVLCEGIAGKTPGITFEMTYGDSTYNVSGNYVIDGAGGKIGILEAGPVQFDNICVEFSGTEIVTCGLML